MNIFDEFHNFIKNNYGEKKIFIWFNKKKNSLLCIQSVMCVCLIQLRGSIVTLCRTEYYYTQFYMRQFYDRNINKQTNKKRRYFCPGELL